MESGFRISTEIQLGSLDSDFGPGEFYLFQPSSTKDSSISEAGCVALQKQDG